MKKSNKKGKNLLVLNDEQQDSSSEEYMAPSYNDLEAVQVEEISNSNDEDLGEESIEDNDDEEKKV